MNTTSEGAATKTTYRIPSNRMDYLKERMATLQRRARKLGCAEPQVVELGFEDVVETEIDPLDGLAVPTGRINRFFTVEVTGAAPAYAGWTFVASVDKMPEVGNLVRVVPGQALPERFRTEEPHCDQCRSNRARINHYVVRSEKGEFKMVGSSCIKDFLGHQSPENIANQASFWASLDGVMTEAESGTRAAGPEYLDLAIFLSHVSAAITKFGWLSASRAREEGRGLPTRAIAMDSMLSRKVENRLHPTDEDRDLAKKSIAWAQSMEVKSDFDHNLSTLAKCEVLPYSGAGIAAAMVFCYKRDAEKVLLREKRAKQFASSAYVGEVGKRQDFTVTVISEYSVEGNYGTTLIYKMIDGEGNCLTWFSSSAALEQGKTYVLKGTVKNHEDYKGTKQTVITRCKVVREIEAAK